MFQSNKEIKANKQMHASTYSTRNAINRCTMLHDNLCSRVTEDNNKVKTKYMGTQCRSSALFLQTFKERKQKLGSSKLFSCSQVMTYQRIEHQTTGRSDKSLLHSSFRCYLGLAAHYCQETASPRCSCCKHCAAAQHILTKASI